MSFLRGNRERRIDRALSHMLNNIDAIEREELRLRDNLTWRDLDEVSARYNKQRNLAYDRAINLELAWREHVANSESE